jgi:hypothetical protein
LSLGLIEETRLKNVPAFVWCAIKVVWECKIKNNTVFVWNAIVVVWLGKIKTLLFKPFSLFYPIELRQWQTIQKHCFYFTQSKLPQWHHTKAVFLFYPIKAATMTHHKKAVFLFYPIKLPQSHSIQKQYCFLFCTLKLP